MQQRNWRELIKPKRLEPEVDTLSATHGKFVAEPLERGFGTTLGSGLRRILLASLQGAAIVQAKFEGVPHEFSTIPGVKEDVTEVVLNLKEVRLKVHTDKPKRLRINKTGPCEVKAGDIQAGSTGDPEPRPAHRNAVGRCLATLGQPRWFAFTTRGTVRHDEVQYADGDALVFGPETRGLPEDVLDLCPPERRVRIPMLEGARSLNLSNAVAVAVYEAWRQSGWKG